MEYGRIPDIGKDVSRLVMGTVRVEPALWEAFVERGGTCFDTAHHYGAESERAIGALVERSGLRERLVVVGKGGHTPYCTPGDLRRQLPESLERLRTDHVDLYLLHRDNQAHPVAAFAEALAEHLAAGRTRAIGVSNWAVARVEAFNEEAAAHGLAPVACLSNQFSLAEMLDPVWEGCLTAFDAASRAWLERTQTPLLAWSAQARGFFAGRPEDEEVRRSWLDESNVERRRRAEELAGRLGAPPAAVALAWVLAQPFPTFAVVGPRDRAELDACLAAVDVLLTAEDVGRLG